MEMTPLTPLTRPPLDHVFPILVGFDYWDRDIISRGDVELPVLRGMINDVIAEWRLLRRVGIRPGNAHIVTDAPVEDVKVRLQKADVWHDDLNLFQVLSEDDMVRFLSTHAFPGLENAAADTIRQYKALLMWSGHGGHEPNDPHRAPSLFMPDGSSLTIAGLLGLVKSMWTWIGARPGEPPPLVAVLNACHTADFNLTPGAGESPLGFADLGAVAIAASSTSAVAHEIHVDGVWRSALSWAATTAISRYRSLESGAIALTYDELMYRVRSLMAAIDVPDLPRLFAPQDEANRPILRGFGDLDLIDPDPTDGNPIEIWPTNNIQPGEAWIYDVQDLNNKELGKVVQIGDQGTKAWNSGWVGFIKDSLCFSSGLLTGSTSFKVLATPNEVDLTSAPSNSNGPAPDLTKAVILSSLGSWPTTSGSVTVPSPYFEITGGANTAYAAWDSKKSKLTVYSDTNSTVLAAGNSATLTFTYKTGGTVTTKYSATDA